MTRTLTMALLGATLGFMASCESKSGDAPSGTKSNRGSAAVNEYLDSYEKTVAGYEEMVTSGAMASNDIMVMMKAVNEMNEKNLELGHKAEALKNEEWTNEQQMRQMKLTSRFSEAMMKMSQSMQK